MKLNISENQNSQKEKIIDDKREESTKNLENLFTLKKIYKISKAILIASIIIIIIVIIIINLLTKNLPERFYGIIPSFIKPDSFGFFESNKNGLENIPKSNIIYKREEFSYIQKIEQSQMGNIKGNSETSIQADIIMYHSKFNFDFQVNEIINKNRTFSYYIIKYFIFVLLSISKLKILN